MEFRNSAWNVADVIVLPFLMLLFTPYFIQKLGTDQYGIWMLVNSIIASIGIVNVGLGDAAIKFISRYRVLGDNNNINRIINTCFSLSLFFLLVILLLGFGISLFIKSINIFGLDETNRSVASAAIRLGSFVFGFKQIEQFLLSIFKGYERYDNSSQASIVSKFIFLIAQVLTVYFGYRLVELFTVSVFVSFIMVLAEIVFVRLKHKELAFKLSLKRETVKEIFSFSTWSWVQSVLGVIAGHIDRFIVITLAGPTFLAYYALASTIGSQIHTVFTASVSWVFPKVSGKTERNESTSGLYYKMQMIIILGGFIVIAVLTLFDNLIFETWLGAETYRNSILLIKIFLFLSFFNMLSIIPYFFLLGSNLIKVSAFFMFLSVIFTIGFMYVCYQFMEVTGLAYGKLFSSILVIPAMLSFVHFKIIDKANLFSGLKIFLPAALLIAALNFNGLLSIPFFLGGLSLVFLLYNEKVNKTL